MVEHLPKVHKTLGLMPRTTEHSLPFNKGYFISHIDSNQLAKLSLVWLFWYAQGSLILKLKVTPRHSVAYPEA